VQGLLLLLVVLLFCLMGSGCVSNLFYYPDQRVYSQPDHPYEDVHFQSRDGTGLHGWWLPASGGESASTVVYFHGNAANLTGHYPQIAWLPAAGFNVFLFDYRGYGQSQGSPTRKGVYEDSRAALAWAVNRSDTVFVLGQSLGGANAMAVLGRNKFPAVKAVVLDSTFYSYRSIVRNKIGAMPVLRYVKWPLSFLVIGNAYSGGPVVDRIAPVPIRLYHGTADRVIPSHQTEMIYARAKAFSRVTFIEGGQHVDMFLRRGNHYKDEVVAFFRAAADGESSP
jgi:fermentation-respiration switch protein FrsA (DUF1100 family)